MDYQKQIIVDIAAHIQAQGFRVFIAERGHYGFYTNTKGTRVICFQVELSGVSFSGNYKTRKPQSTGSGWRICISYASYNDYAAIFETWPPQWATGGASFKLTTLAEYLAAYQASSKFKEVTECLEK